MIAFTRSITSRVRSRGGIRELDMYEHWRFENVKTHWRVRALPALPIAPSDSSRIRMF